MTIRLLSQHLVLGVFLMSNYLRVSVIISNGNDAFSMFIYK